MAIKAIFFDAAGTLIRPIRPVGQSYALLAKKYGMDLPPQDLTRRFRACFSSAPPLAFPRTRADQLQDLERAWWKELVRRIFEPWQPFTRFDDYFDELFGYFSRPEAWSLYPEAEETLAALKERGFLIDVVSNFDSRLFGILEGLRILSRFDSIVISSRTGWAKPAPQIFKKALSLHHLRSEEAMHVGDSPEKDALGAAKAGLIGVLLDRNGKETSDAFPRIRNLKEILTIVDGRG